MPIIPKVSTFTTTPVQICESYQYNVAIFGVFLMPQEAAIGAGAEGVLPQSGAIVPAKGLGERACQNISSVLYPPHGLVGKIPQRRRAAGV